MASDTSLDRYRRSMTVAIFPAWCSSTRCQVLGAEPNGEERIFFPADLPITGPISRTCSRVAAEPPTYR